MLRALFLLAALVQPWGAAAQSGGLDSQHPLPANYAFERLDNGLEVLLVQDTTYPIATVSYVNRAGWQTRPEGQSGLPFLLSQLIFTPNEAFPSQERLLAFARRHDLRYAPGLAREHARFVVHTPAGRLDSALHFLAAAVRQPRFEPAYRVRAKARLKASISNAHANRHAYLIERLHQHLWRESAFQRVPWADYGQARNLQAAGLRRHHANYFQPNYSLVIVVGDIDTAEARRRVQTQFGDWQAPAYTSPKLQSFDVLKRDSAFVAFNEFSRRPVVKLAWQLPPVAGHERPYYIARLFAALVRMKSGPVHRHLVDAGMQRGLRAEFRPSAFRSSLHLTLFPDTARPRATLQAFWQAMHRLTQPDSLRSDELWAAKRQLLLEMALKRARNNSHAKLLAEFWAGPGLATFADFNNAITTITADELRAFVEAKILRNPVVQGTELSTEHYLKDSAGTYFEQVRKGQYRPGETEEEAILAKLKDRPEPAAPADTVISEPDPEGVRSVNEAAYEADSGSFLAIGSAWKKRVDSLMVFFPFDRTAFDSAGQISLETVAEALMNVPEAKLLLIGHTDAKGRAEYNLRLSRKRARFVKTLLVREFVLPPERINIQGKGEETPLVPGSDPDARQKNRRVEFRLLLPESSAESPASP